MPMKIAPDWLWKAIQKQADDVSDPAPFVTRRDLQILAQRKAEREARQKTNGNGSHVSDSEAPAVPESIARPARTSP